MEDIRKAYGAVTLHRVVPAVGAHVGPYFLEREGLRAMVFHEDIEEAEDGAGGGSGSADAEMEAEVRLMTVNVDGLDAGGPYALSHAERMEQIITMAVAAPLDVLMLQEVVPDMFEVLQRRLPDWFIRRRAPNEPDGVEYFNVTAARIKPDETTSKAFTSSRQGRHRVTIRRAHWTLSNVHAESNCGIPEQMHMDRDERVNQLNHLSHMHEFEEDQTCVVAGDFNVREGEDLCLRKEGWRDVWDEARARGPAGARTSAAWTWRKGGSVCHGPSGSRSQRPRHGPAQKPRHGETRTGPNHGETRTGPRHGETRTGPRHGQLGEINRHLLSYSTVTVIW